MRQLSHPLPPFDFRSAATAVLIKQCDDESALQDHHGRYRRNLRRIGLPYGQNAISYFATRRQIAVADTPSLHLSPVENGPNRTPSRDRNGRWAFAVEDAQRQRG